MVNGKKGMRKKFTKFRPMIRSRHPSHSPLRLRNKLLPLLPFKSLVRFGSSTDVNDITEKGGNRIELNSVQAIANSSSKIKMKEAFSKNNVITPEWNYASKLDNSNEKETNEGVYFTTNIFGEESLFMKFPIVMKSEFGSRNRGNTKINNLEELKKWKESNRLERFIVEKFKNYNREYRIHVNEQGGFYFVRKMLKSDTPKRERWFRNDSNSVWILQENPEFDTPVNIKEIENNSIKALKAVGLDFGAVDIRVQSSVDGKGVKRTNPLFTIIEINSAPSFGQVTLQKYIEEIPKMLQQKYNKIK